MIYFETTPDQLTEWPKDSRDRLRVLFFINSNIAILHILHVLPWVSLFLEVIFDNITHITHITRGPWFLEIQNLQYYTYYMYYHGSLFFGKSNLAILHILHILPGVLGFYKLKYCNITHITCITMGLSFFGSEIWQYYTYYTYYIPLQPTTCPISTPQQASTLFVAQLNLQYSSEIEIHVKLNYKLCPSMGKVEDRSG